MADIHPVPSPSMMVPAVDPAAAGAQRDADLAETMRVLSGPNPCDSDMGLPSALTQDGGQ